MNHPLSLRKILLSLAGFVILWAVVTDAWGYSDCAFSFRYGTYLYAYLSRLVWAVPAFCLIVRFNESLYLNKKELFSPPRRNKSLAIVLGVTLLWAGGTMLANHKGFWLNKSINLPLEVIKYIIVGFVEEAVFRGWGYNALSKVTTDRKAVLLSTIFFVLVHWPAFFVKFCRFGTFDFAGMLMQSLSAAVWGVVFCWLMKKGKTIWNPIIAHAFYDLTFVLLVG